MQGTESWQTKNIKDTDGGTSSTKTEFQQKIIVKTTATNWLLQSDNKIKIN